MEARNNNFCDIMDINIQLGRAPSIASLINLRNSATAQTYSSFQGPLNQSIGYIAWASVNKESLTQVRRHGTLPIYPYEWAEGRLILITELLYQGSSRFAIRKLLSDLFINRRVITFSRNKVVTTYCRHGKKFRLVDKIRIESQQPAK